MSVLMQVSPRTTSVVMKLMAFAFMCQQASGQTDLVDRQPLHTNSAPAGVSSSLKQLQGKWKSVKSNYKDATHFEGWGIHFRGGSVTDIMPAEKGGQGEEEGETVQFSVDESKTPMWIDFGEQKGIFQIKDDLLIVRFGNKKSRPTEFKLVPAIIDTAVVAPGAYPQLPTRAPDVGFWVPFELDWDDGLPQLLVFKKVQ